MSILVCASLKASFPRVFASVALHRVNLARRRAQRASPRPCHQRHLGHPLPPELAFEPQQSGAPRGGCDICQS